MDHYVLYAAPLSHVKWEITTQLVTTGNFSNNLEQSFYFPPNPYLGKSAIFVKTPKTEVNCKILHSLRRKKVTLANTDAFTERNNPPFKTKMLN